MRKLINEYLKDPRKYFYILISIFIIILILQQLHLISWILTLLTTLKPILLGLLLPFFLEPFIRKIPFKRKISVSLFYIFLLIILLFIFLILISSGIQILKDIFHKIQNLLIYLQNDINLIIQSQQFLDESDKIIQFLSTYSLDSIRLLINFITTFIFSIGFAFLISIELDSISNEFKKLISFHQKFEQFYLQFSSLVFQYFKGLLLDSLFLLFVITIFLYLIKVKYGLFFALFICLLNLFPYIGAIIGTLLCILYVFLTSPDKTILCLTGLFVIQQIESIVIHPLIFSKTMKVHPLHLLIAILIYEYLFGIFGLILSPLLAMLQQIALESYLTILDQSQIGGWEEL